MAQLALQVSLLFTFFTCLTVSLGPSGFPLASHTMTVLSLSTAPESFYSRVVFTIHGQPLPSGRALLFVTINPSPSFEIEIIRSCRLVYVPKYVSLNNIKICVFRFLKNARPLGRGCPWIVNTTRE